MHVCRSRRRAARNLSRYGYGNLRLEQVASDAGYTRGALYLGAAARAVALAFVGALEGAVSGLAGQAPHDEVLAARAAAGVLGLEPA
jgi:hypothetical protein